MTSNPTSAGMVRRLVARVGDADPVLRILATATLVGAVGRGLSMTITVLFLGFAVHLPAGQIALVVVTGSIASLVAGLIGGQLSDRVSARRLAFGAMLVSSLALAGFAAIVDVTTAFVLVGVQQAALGAAQSARAAIIGRAFTGEARVGARAVLRTVTNAGIAIGSAVAGAALLLDTPLAYRVALAVAGATFLAGQLNLLRLPARVDAESKPAVTERRERRGRPGRPGRSPWTDPRYVLLSALSGIFAVQLALEEFGVPLWVTRDTAAPRAIVSVLLIVNTSLVIVFTVPLSRGTHLIRRAGRMTLLAGLLMVVACAVYALAGTASAVGAVVALLVAAAVHAFAEILSQNGGWGLGFELADAHRIGAYQGVFGTTYAVGAAIGPPIITLTVLDHGTAGWLALSVILLAAAVGVSAIAEQAHRAQPVTT